MDAYKDIGLYTGPSGFEGAIGKLGRARYQVNELDERCQAFLESHPLRFIHKFNRGPGEWIGDYTISANAIRVPNREWGVLIGEIAHNLRSALDHAAYAAAESPTGSTQFPIFIARDDWDQKSGRMVKSIPRNALALIEQAQPYRYPDPATHELAILNKLSNHDKHRLLHTTALVVAEVQPRIVGKHGVAAIHEVAVRLGPLEHEREMVRLKIGIDAPEPEIELQGSVGLAIAIAEGDVPAIADTHIISVLKAILRAVTYVVGSVEAACQSPHCHRP